MTNLDQKINLVEMSAVSRVQNCDF